MGYIILYDYMALAYIQDYSYKGTNKKKLHDCSKNELIAVCKETIAWLKELSAQIRELRESDI